MGIDAEILVRNVPSRMVNDEWLKEKSWQLVTSIGAETFFIKDGLPPEEHRIADKAWRAAFDSHPLYADWEAARDDWDRRRELNERIFADTGRSPEVRRLAIDRTLTHYRDDDDEAPGSVYRQDGVDVPAKEGECLLELSLMGRYYGEGYERGDILKYCAIAEWLEANIPGCEVWYGGDSSGVCAEPFTAERRAALRAHLYSDKGRDYFNRSGWGDFKPRPPSCSLCPGNCYRGAQYGFGGKGDYAAFHCSGCGKSMQTRDAGKTWHEEKDRN